jgi:hypothetical protein
LASHVGEVVGTRQSEQALDAPFPGLVARFVNERALQTIGGLAVVLEAEVGDAEQV